MARGLTDAGPVSRNANPIRGRGWPLRLATLVLVGALWQPMLPAAAVSGWYFSHPRSQYFVVGRVSKEQAEDYARRKGVPLQQVERWLASNLDYDPD